jgi:hypothetical protein
LLTSRRCVARNIERTTFLCIFTARPVSNCQRTMSRKPGKTLKICSHIISVFLRAFGAFQLPSTIYHLPSTIYQLPSTIYQLPSTIYHLPTLQLFILTYLSDRRGLPRRSLSSTYS